MDEKETENIDGYAPNNYKSEVKEEGEKKMGEYEHIYIKSEQVEDQCNINSFHERDTKEQQRIGKVEDSDVFIKQEVIIDPEENNSSEDKHACIDSLFENKIICKLVTVENMSMKYDDNDAFVESMENFQDSKIFIKKEKQEVPTRSSHDMEDVFNIKQEINEEADGEECQSSETETYISPDPCKGRQFFSCNLCSYKPRNIDTLNRHIEEMHCENVCHVCGFKTKNKRSFQRHVKHKHGKSDEIHKCKLCKFETKWKYSLTFHMKIKHAENSNVYECQYCAWTTKYKGNWINHMKIHDTTCDPYKCPECPYETIRKYDLKHHIKTKHDENGEVYKCTICAFETRVKASWIIHMKMKHDETREVYKCHICTFETKYKRNWVNHVTIKHIGTFEVYKCTECPYESNYKHCLSQHIRMKHDDSVESLNCDLCSYQTKDKFHLLAHIKRKHTNIEKLHKCQLCTYETRYNEDLMRHVKQRHGENRKVYKCPECLCETISKSYLRKHIRTKHDCDAELLSKVQFM